MWLTDETRRHLIRVVGNSYADTLRREGRDSVAEKAAKVWMKQILAEIERIPAPKE